MVGGNGLKVTDLESVGYDRALYYSKWSLTAICSLLLICIGPIELNVVWFVHHVYNINCDGFNKGANTTILFIKNYYL